VLDLGDSIRQVVLRGSIAAASVTFFDGDQVADPGVVTVTVARDDGTVLATDEATDGTSATPRTFALPRSATASLDVLRCDWTSATLGTLTTYVELVGAHVSSLGQINAVLDQRGEVDKPVSATVPLEAKTAARAVATDALERTCGVAFAPRYARGTFDASRCHDLLLPTPRVLSVRSVARLGSPVDLDDIAVTSEGALFRRYAGWPGGRMEYDIAWEHGHRTPPADVSRAVSLLAVYALMDGPWDDRGYGVVDEGGFARLLTAGVGGAAFSVPEVQAVVQRYRQPVIA
jgi:hypothetical protein